MPSIVTDPSLSPLIIQNSSIFDYPDTPAPSILDFQTIPTQPLPANTTTATGLLFPDLLLPQRLGNFPDNLYDLSPSSALMHFLAAMMGPSGAGQLRQRQNLARLQSAITSTNFYDLDSFYGSLFGALRGPSGSLPANTATGTTFNPYTDLASADGWDSIQVLDALFRERIIALARAITLGGTVPGLRALGEAVSGVPCEVYEVWRLIDAQGSQTVPGLTWSALQSDFAAWGAIPAETWDEFQGVIIYGGLGINARNEIIIQPRRGYDDSQAGLTQQAADLWGITRVCEALAPAFSLASVVTMGAQADAPVPFSGLWADSEYWEISVRVTPNNITSPAYAPTVSVYQPEAAIGDPGSSFPQPLPPFSQGQGTQYSCIPDVSNVTASSATGTAQPPFTALNNQDFEIDILPNGQQMIWRPSYALMDPVRAASSRAVSPIGVKSSPYSGPRVPVATAG